MDNPHPMQGHNNPPSPFDEIEQEIKDLYEETKNWCDGEPVETPEQEQAVSELMALIRDAEKRADALRKDETKPLDDAKKAIQDKFNKLIGKNKSVTGLTVLALETCKKAIEPYRQKREAEAREIARIEQENAREAERIAQEEMRKAQESADLEAREKAEKLAQDAKQAEKVAKKATKAATTGLGLRRSYRAEVTDYTRAAQHFWRVDPTPFHELVDRLAQQHASNNGGPIDGVTIHEDRKAV